MNTRRMVLTGLVFAAALLLMFSASAPLGASDVPPASPSVLHTDFPPGDDPQPPPPSQLPEIVNNPGWTATVIMGTMWQPQNRKQFQQWFVYGWGTAVRLKPAKAPSDEWVHISPAEVYYLNDKPQKIRQVYVCGATTNPTVSRPLAVHLWSWNNDRFFTTNIPWANTTARQCQQVNISPAIVKAGVNISLLVRFANGTDVVTLQEVLIWTTD